MTNKQRFTIMKKFSFLYDYNVESVEAFQMGMITISEALATHNEMVTDWKALEKQYGKKVSIDDVNDFFAMYMVSPETMYS